jgi:hypothetical protein
MAIRHNPITMVRVLRRDKYYTNNTERQVVLSRHTRIGLMTYENRTNDIRVPSDWSIKESKASGAPINIGNIYGY